jgi:hypothetical protein
MLRRWLSQSKKRRFRDVWPIDPASGRAPDGWRGWPEGKAFSLVLTHDVETGRGQDRVRRVVELEKEMGFRSGFNFVPERYAVSAELREWLGAGGFEVGVHDLWHDGKLYSSRRHFLKCAERINQYLREWNARGFRSGAMHHNLEWIGDLDVAYDMSTFDTDPLEPQPDPVGTIFPFLVARKSGRPYVELPYTLPQDFTLLVILREKTIDIWKDKLDWIARNRGMAMINVHPDYMQFAGSRRGREEYPAAMYRDFLEYCRSKHSGEYWHALPGEVADFCFSQAQLPVRSGVEAGRGNGDR